MSVLLLFYRLKVLLSHETVIFPSRWPIHKHIYYTDADRNILFLAKVHDFLALTFFLPFRGPNGKVNP